MVFSRKKVTFSREKMTFRKLKLTFTLRAQRVYPWG